ncbi:MAG: ribbon-helix-helix protein, CopG family [Desulfurococcales archaeon]|nr:ribbon-helix-helix protein, CopG family [Desulfurococcales archaeon]
MGNQVIPVRLDPEVIKFIDTLVAAEIFNSRSEALRELINSGIDSLKWLTEVSEAVNKLFELEKKEGDIPIKLEGALKELLGERGRF